MYLATGAPTVRHEGDRIIAAIPSGSNTVEIALDFGQATRLGNVMARIAERVILDRNTAASAEIVRLKPKRRRES